MHTRTIYFILTLLLLVPNGARAADKITYQDHIKPIFQNRCFTCHNADKSKAGLDLTAYSSTMAGSSGGEVLVPENPDDSILYLVVTHQEEPTMPPKQDKLADDQLELIRKWIAGGLLDSSTSKAKKTKKATMDIGLTQSPTGKPDAPPPMPAHLLLEPAVLTDRSAAVAAIATNPWAPLAAISGQKQVLLYNTDTLELAGVLPFPEGFAQSLAFSRSGRLLLAGGGRGGHSGRVVVWQISTGQRVIELGEELDAVLGADIMADQTQVVLGGPSRLIRIYSTADGELLHTIKKHTEWVTAVSYSPDGVLLATGDRNGGLYVWEAYTAGEYATLGGHGGAITALSWRDDANVLASAGEDGRIRLWEMVNISQAANWNAHGGGVTSVHFTHDGRIVSSGRDKHVRIWDQQGKQLHAFEPFGDIALQAAFTHDGKRVIGGDWTGELRVWNVEDGKVIGSLSGNPPSIAQRLEAATGLVSQVQPQHDQAAAALKQAQTEAVDPLAKLAQAQKALADANNKKESAKTVVTQSQTELEKTAAAHADAIKQQAARKADSDRLAKAMTEATAAHDQATAAHEQAQQRVASRSTLASQLGQAAASAKAEQEKDPDDAALAQAAADAEKAAQSGQTSLTNAKDAEAAGAKKVSEMAQTMTAAKQQAAEAVTAHQQAKMVAQQQATMLKTAQDNMAAVAKQFEQMTASATQAASMHQSAAEQAKPFEDKLVASSKAFTEIDAQLNTATRLVAKWQAAQINTQRLAARDHWQTLQAQHVELADAANQVQAAHDEANQALDAATKAMTDAPGVAEKKKQMLTQAQQALKQADDDVQSAQAIVADKQKFLAQLDQTAKQLAQRSAQDAENETLAQAAAKAQQTVDLLTQDMEAARGVMAQRVEMRMGGQTEVTQATKAVEQAQHNMAEAPKLVDERRSVVNDMKAKLDTARATQAAAAQTADQAHTAFDELTIKYEAALPGE